MTENPYEPPAESEDVPTRLGLCCPYCEETFRLTWPRYLKHPFGVQECPACEKRSKIKASWTAQILLGVASAVSGIGSMLLAEVSLVLGLIAFSVLIGAILVVDRWKDEQRELRPLESYTQ